MRGRHKGEAPRGYLTVAQVAQRVGLNQYTVYKDLRTGTLAGERVGHQWLVPEGALTGYRTVRVGQHFWINGNEFRVSNLTPIGFEATALVREDVSMSGWREREVTHG